MEVLAVGLCALDLVYEVEAPPGPDEKVSARSQAIAAGGPATGAAVTVAALGGAPTLVTALGEHPLAAVAAAEVASCGVRVVDATPSSDRAPAVSSAMVAADGRRSVVSVNAAGLDVSPPVELALLSAGAGVVLLDGHHPRLALAAARAAAGAGRPVVLDAGSWKPVLSELLPLVDLAVCSSVFRVPGTGTAAGSAAALRASYGVPFVAVTAGPEPVRWEAGNRSGEVAVPDVAAVDTLGAGDAYHGAVAHALVRAGASRPVPVDTAVGALVYAARVAAIRCGTGGPRAWLSDPRLAELRED